MGVYESTTVGVGTRAPVDATSEIAIAAGRDVVWGLLTDFERWPAWNRDVGSIAVDGPAIEGMSFRWKAGAMTIVSVIQRMRAPQLIAWTGKTPGIRAIHVWALEETGATTTVRTRETWDGGLVRLLRSPMRRMLQRSLDRGLRSLKEAAERAADAAGQAGNGG